MNICFGIMQIKFQIYLNFHIKLMINIMQFKRNNLKLNELNN